MAGTFLHGRAVVVTPEVQCPIDYLFAASEGSRGAFRERTADP